jgi:hypothetical protein
MTEELSIGGVYLKVNASKIHFSDDQLAESNKIAFAKLTIRKLNGLFERNNIPVWIEGSGDLTVIQKFGE